MRRLAAIAVCLSFVGCADEAIAPDPSTEPPLAQQPQVIEPAPKSTPPPPVASTQPGVAPVASEATPRPRLPAKSWTPLSPRTRISFAFEDAELADVIRAIADLTGRGFVYDSTKLKAARISFHPPTRLTVGEAWEAFLLILDLHGFALVQHGAYAMVVETKGIVTQPLPVIVSPH